MITPDEFKEKIKYDNVALPEAYNPYMNRARFFTEATAAEKSAIENFRNGLKNGGSVPRKLRIKLDLNWNESLIAELCTMYRDKGWTKVSYNKNDWGIREPQGYWTITVDTKC